MCEHTPKHFDLCTGPVDDPTHQEVCASCAVDIACESDVELSDFKAITEEVDGMDPIEWLDAMAFLD